MNSQIKVKNLKKKYKVPVRKHGLIESFKSLVHPVYNYITAVDNISFKIDEGEIVGFIGPNGAGKTTTLKMLAGLLYPTAGNIKVAGFKPYEKKSKYLKQVSMIMGNKSQLNQNITVLDSFYVTKEIYGISTKDYNERLEELVNLLDIKELLPKLPRNLSLGERAKCEFAAALLYKPKIIFLDEPTLGMDVSIRFRLHNFIKEYNKKYNTTIILTSHYMGDITSLCSRVILINKGNLLYDGGLKDLGTKLLPFKLVKITSSEEKLNIESIKKCINSDAKVISKDEQTCIVRVKKEDVLTVTTSLLHSDRLVLSDLTIEDPSIEAVIDQIYREGVIK
ncbi:MULTISPECIES: ABC transporter ATP-binding protein [Clostridium]|uniref:ABC transporter ATP-binding protein n=1 Tax=Clostridium TaxID=1485 RepID=UPI000826252A|nr:MULTISPECIES: ATP-binding cassette domain-containing protein [Clostridium]PJI06523.1 ABC transporter [Clostridium sp. CT7]